MFWNKKKTQLEILIEKDGLDHAANRIAEIINEKIGSLDVARQFVLEELDAARQGDSEALRFVQASGFKPDEYIGAMSNSFEEVDGTDGPQMFLNNLMMSQLMHNRDLMTSFRIAITDKIMQMWNLGKYQNASNDPMDTFTFDNSVRTVSAPKGQSKLITVLDTLVDILKIQMWHVQKIDYGSQHSNGVIFAVVGQSYLKFNGPDIHTAREVEASRCTLGLIENDLDVLPTVMLQLSFNFYQNDIEVNLHLFDSCENGGYNAIKGLDSMIDFTRDELLGSFAHANPDSELEQLMAEYPLFESKLLYNSTFYGGPIDLANHLEGVMRDVMKISTHTIMNL